MGRTELKGGGSRRTRAKRISYSLIGKDRDSIHLDSLGIHRPKSANLVSVLPRCTVSAQQLRLLPRAASYVQTWCMRRERGWCCATPLRGLTSEPHLFFSHTSSLVKSIPFAITLIPRIYKRLQINSPILGSEALLPALSLGSSLGSIYFADTRSNLP